MTGNQIRYREYRENARHNVVTERLGAEQLRETQRSNQANEAIRWDANNATRYSADVHAAASRYAADTSAETQRYVADSNAAASRYSADSSRYSAMYNAQLNATTQRYASDQSAAVSARNADIAAETSKYSTDQNVAVAQQRADTEVNRLEFDRATQAFKNTLETKRNVLEEIKTHAYEDMSNAQALQARANATKAYKDIEVSLQDYALRARQQDNNDAYNRANTALTQMRTEQAYWQTVNTNMNTVSTAIDSVLKILKEAGL